MLRAAPNRRLDRHGRDRGDPGAERDTTPRVAQLLNWCSSPLITASSHRADAIICR